MGQPVGTCEKDAFTSHNVFFFSFSLDKTKFMWKRGSQDEIYNKHKCFFPKCQKFIEDITMQYNHTFYFKSWSAYTLFMQCLFSWAPSFPNNNKNKKTLPTSPPMHPEHEQGTPEVYKAYIQWISEKGKCFSALQEISKALANLTLHLSEYVHY